MTRSAGTIARRIGLVALISSLVLDLVLPSPATPATGPSNTIATGLAVDQRTGTAFVLSMPVSTQTGAGVARGTLTVLATRAGPLHATCRVGVGDNPSTIVVDERAERVLVLNGGGGDKYAGFTGGSVSVLDLRALEGCASASRVVIRTTPLGRRLPRALELDRTTGRAVVASWILPAHGVITQTVTGGLSVLETRTGALLRTVPLDVAAEAVAVDEAAGRAFVLPGMQGPHATLHILDTRTGALVQTWEIGPSGRALAVDAHTARVFIGTFTNGRNGVQVRPTRGGALITSVPVPGGVVAFGVDVPRGHVFVQSAAGFDNPATASGAVSMLDARDGTVLGTVQVGLSNPFTQILLGGTPQTLAVDAPSGHVLVATTATAGAVGPRAGQGAVSVLAAQGRGLQVLHTRTLVGSPGAIVVDTAARHAVVVTMDQARPGVSMLGISLLDVRTGALVGSLSL